MKERKRKITVITVIGIMLILAITTFTYAIWSRTHTQTGINKNTYACFEISYAETNGAGITMENGFPQKDEEGLKNNPYEVQIKNTCDTVSTYNVILNKQEDSNLDDSHLKVAVDNDYKLLSEATPTDTRQIDDFTNEASYIIGTGVVGPKQTKIVQIRSWMDKDTTETDGEDKSFTFKITIEAVAGDGNLLSGKILAVNKLHIEEPDFTKGFPNTNTSEDETKTKSGVYVAKDDEGDTYYFRGKVENNYVKLSQNSDLVWRIVRINGDGSIRLIMSENIGETVINENEDDFKYVEYYNENTKINSAMKTYLEEWYQANMQNYDDKIAYGTYCNDTSFEKDEDYEKGYITYNAYVRMSNNPTLKCIEGKYNLKIGLLSADEMNFAGIGSSLQSPEKVATIENYLYHDYYWWSMSPGYLDADNITFEAKHIDYIISHKGGFDDMSLAGEINYPEYVHPVINLNSDVTVTGTGTAEDPYVVQ